LKQNIGKNETVLDSRVRARDEDFGHEEKALVDGAAQQEGDDKEEARELALGLAESYEKGRRDLGQHDPHNGVRCQALASRLVVQLGRDAHDYTEQVVKVLGSARRRSLIARNTVHKVIEKHVAQVHQKVCQRTWNRHALIQQTRNACHRHRRAHHAVPKVDPIRRGNCARPFRRQLQKQIPESSPAQQ
jgi:hypothetical protein